MTVRTYTTEAERVRALESAMAAYRRTGVLETPRPAQLVEHEAVRYRRLNPGIAPGLPGATVEQLAAARADGRGLTQPPPAPGLSVSDQEVAEVVREAAGMIDDVQAQSWTARRLNEAGATDGQVSTAMRQVQAEREAAAVRDLELPRRLRRPGVRDAGWFA